jgi:transcriptional regulator with XRE-family HTH domain
MQDPGRAIRTRVGGVVRRLRLLRGLSQERLAELAGNSWKHVGQIERGQVNVGLDVLGRIAHALAVDVADLFVQPRGRRRPATSVHLITGDDLDRIIEIAGRAKAERAPRSKRASR